MGGYWLDGRLETKATWRNRQSKGGSKERKREYRALPNELAESLIRYLANSLRTPEWENWENKFPLDT